MDKNRKALAIFSFIILIVVGGLVIANSNIHIGSENQDKGYFESIVNYKAEKQGITEEGYIAPEVKEQMDIWDEKGCSYLFSVFEEDFTNDEIAGYVFEENGLKGVARTIVKDNLKNNN